MVTYASGYLDLTPTQRRQLRTGLREALEQHRHEELGPTVAFLRTVAAYAADGLMEPELDELLSALMRFYEDGVPRAVSVFSPVMADLSDVQIAHFSQELAEYNRDYQEKYLAISRSERLDERATLVVTHVEKWTGDLSRAQRSLVQGISRSWPDLAQVWYDHDVAMQQGLLHLLRAGAPVDEVRLYLTGWWLLQTERSSELARHKDRLIEGVVKLVRALDATLTVEQREHFLERVHALADVLETLIPAPEATVAAVAP